MTTSDETWLGQLGDWIVGKLYAAFAWLLDALWDKVLWVVQNIELWGRSQYDWLLLQIQSNFPHVSSQLTTWNDTLNQWDTIVPIFYGIGLATTCAQTWLLMLATRFLRSFLPFGRWIIPGS